MEKLKTDKQKAKLVWPGRPKRTQPRKAFRGFSTLHQGSLICLVSLAGSCQLLTLAQTCPSLSLIFFLPLTPSTAWEATSHLCPDAGADHHYPITADREDEGNPQMASYLQCPHLPDLPGAWLALELARPRAGHFVWLSFLPGILSFDGG